MVSIGNARNPYLPYTGSNLVAGAGLGPVTSLVDTTMDFDNFINEYVDGAEGEAYLAELEGVSEVSSFIGAGASRFMLTYMPEQPNSSLMHFLVRTEDAELIDGLVRQINQELPQRYPSADVSAAQFMFGPNAEAKLAAAQANVRVARAAMLPKLNLTLIVGSGADHFPDVLRNPFTSLAAGLVTPVFNNGRLRAERDKAVASQEELLQNYRGAILAGFGDVEKALNTLDGIDRQLHWQAFELQQARKAFDIAESRYQAGAEDWLSVLDSQRTLYTAQDLNVQLRLSRLQASIALYKALGGGWESDIR